MTTRILIVDDFQPFRNTLRSILERDSSLRVIGEACDGMEAIEKAATLRPDVLLLDIGMPRLNGIEAAKAIRQKMSPESAIIFVTQEDDCDIRNSALGLGAAAYLLKSTVGSELLLAIGRAMLHRQSQPHQPEFPLPEPAILLQGL